jgi:hypothetical protein
VIALPLLKFEISQCKERDDFQSLIVVEIGSFVTCCENIVLKGSQIFAFEEHTGYLLFYCILTPLFEY